MNNMTDSTENTEVESTTEIANPIEPLVRQNKHRRMNT